MKRIIIACIAVGASVASLSAQKAPRLESKTDSLAYFIGASQGASFNEQSADSYKDKELTQYRKEFIRGLRDAVLADTVNTGYRDGQRAGSMMLDEFIRMNAQGMPVNLKLFCDMFAEFYQNDNVSAAERDRLYAELRDLLEPMQRLYKQKQDEARAKAVREQQERVTRNRLAGEKFIADLKAADKDVVTTGSGLVYKVVRKGEGPTLGEAGGKAKVKYTGRLVDGSQFDSSGDRTYEFLPSQVIKGFGEGLKLMQKGSKYILYIPENLAYGESGPPAIGPAQTLIFEVEMVDILPD